MNLFRKSSVMTGILAMVALAVVHASALGQITGRVTDPDNVAVPDALVCGYAGGNVLLHSCYTDSVGGFCLPADSSSAPRMIVVAAFGFTPDTVMTDGDAEHYCITLQPSMLREVVVAGKRNPKISRDGNKLIVDNISNSPYGVDNNAIGFLKYLPMLQVAESGSIKIPGSLHGKVTVLRNGKTLSMPQEQWLSTLRIEEVERIEVCANPLGDYKVGNTGVINIILKRRPDEGVKYSLYANESFSNALRTYLSPSIDYSKGKTILTVGINTYNENTKQETTNAYDLLDSKESRHDILTDRLHSVGLTPYINLDYELNKCNSIGIQAQAHFSDKEQKILSQGLLSGTDEKILSANHSFTRTSTPKKLLSFGGNLNYKLTLSKSDILLADIDYFHNQPSDHRSSKMTNTGNLNSDTIAGVGINSSKSDAVSGLLRYEGSKSSAIKYRAGISYTWMTVSEDNCHTFDSQSVSNWSESFTVSQNIMKCYAAFDFRLSDRLSGSAMLEFLWHRLCGHYHADDKGWSRFNKTGLCPQINLGYRWSDTQYSSLSFFRMWSAPYFRQLSPAVIMLDEHTYRKGNPNLKGGFLNSFGLNHTFLPGYSVFVLYIRSDVAHASCSLPDGNGSIMIVPVNRVKNSGTSVNVSANQPLLNNKLLVGFFYRYSWNKSVLDVPGLTDNPKSHTSSAVLDISYSFGLTTPWTVNVSFTHQSKGKDSDGYITPESDSVHFGISKRFKSSNLNIHFFRELGSGNMRTLVSDQYLHTIDTKRYWNGSITYTVTLGNSKAKSVINRSTNNVQQLYGTSSK